MTTAQHPLPLWTKVIDQRRCIGCHACTVACKAEHDVALGITRTFVKEVEAGVYPNTRRAFQVTRCNQCETAPCAAVCPTRAMYRRDDGIVDFDRDICVGCKACITACPYDAIFMDPVTRSAEKCNFCAHRIDRGLEPACVSVCPTEAIVVGDGAHPHPRLADLLRADDLTVRKPQRGTSPRLFYVGADSIVLDPLPIATDGRGARTEEVAGPAPGWADAADTANAAPLPVFGRARRPAWGWPVSAYTWAKGVAAGPFLLWAVLATMMPLESQDWTIAVSVVSVAFLALTAALLVADLSHPERFLLLLVRPQWGSWLVRGAFLLIGMGGALILFLIAVVAEVDLLRDIVGWALLPLAAAVVGYTALLFRASRACELWRSALLGPHLLVQATLAGAAVLILIESAAGLDWSDLRALAIILLAATAAHAALGIAEAWRGHADAEAREAAAHLRSGPLAHWYRAGLMINAAAALLAVVAWAAAEPTAAYVAAALALAGLPLYEHAYVQAGQKPALT